MLPVRPVSGDTCAGRLSHRSNAGNSPGRFSEPDFRKCPDKLAGWSDKFEQKLTIIAAMGQVIEFSRKEVAVGSGHGGGSIDAMARLLQRIKGLKK
jgi:hypothetical protein